MRALALFALPATLVACAPEPPPPPVQLDCNQSFDALRSAITAQPGIDPKPLDGAEPYRFYSAAQGKASYMITEPGAPAHPAILMQQVGPERRTVNTGCAYRDKTAYAELLAYLTGLSRATK
ncbi:hypothetical protein [Phenylobacterium deserti]|uniref:Uncharacterized protein n=1 Tax=Phenylobacterium deserti TaxID=1914756 RepID=A0A328APH8_9CAUL|nr:hypothetical protein [Phenylobacterium deserti]RAK56497.1 hypothetical protein DJ018_00490 [Phenylobacterium deserti]